MVGCVVLEDAVVAAPEPPAVVAATGVVVGTGAAANAAATKLANRINILDYNFTSSVDMIFI